MKIGLLTFPHSPSIGASLQMFALYEALEKMGHIPEVINYQNTYMYKRKHMGENNFYLYLTRIISYKTSLRFKRFESNLVFNPQKIISSKEELQQISKKYDYIIVGSDQVWNPNITGGDLSYFLNFCEDYKKISYAASFGVNELNFEFKAITSKLLKKIPSLSVREEVGSKIVKNLINRDVPIVLDPTFLLKMDFWNKIISNRNLVDKPYIFSFVFNKNKDNTLFLNKLSTDKGLPVVVISDNPLRRSTKKINYVSGIGPKEFLKLIKGAEYIVTDSFHGTVFSILFNKTFFVSMSTKTNSRLETLLSSLELNSQIIDNNLMNLNDIKYNYVNQKIDLLRDYSMNFLLTSIFENNLNE